MKYFSLFSGIGGFELGIQQAYETIATKNNQSIIEICDVKNAIKKDSSIEVEMSARNVLESINLNGESITTKKVLRQDGDTTPYENRDYLKCTEKSVLVVEKQKNNSSHLNTKMEMDIKTENDMEQDICINSHSKKTTKRNTKSSATTVITQEQDTESAPTCVGFSEVDKYAIKIYEKHFPKHINFGDITKINADTLPDFDFLVGGFPCQSFSIAGKRGGFADTRGTLFFDIARILLAKKPRLLLLENVKGLLSHDNGKTFSTIIATLDELGYDLQWQVLNSKNFGVPQNRERVFIIGHLRGTSRPKVFPFTDDGGQIDELPRHLSNTLTRRYEGAQAVGTYIGESKLNAQEIKVVGTLETDGWEKRFEQIRRVHGIDGISPTIPTGTGGGVMTKIQDAGKIRRLTPTECARLQGFPDDWCKDLSDTQAYKCYGNAVTVNVISAIMEKLLTEHTNQQVASRQ